MKIRSDWKKEEIRQIHDSPLLELTYQAATVHRAFYFADRMQICNLISIKTGGCSENCKYCPQSARYQTDVRAEPLMEEEEILDLAKKGLDGGASRICLATAWRSPRDGKQFDLILRVIRKIRDLGGEVCCTLGMVTESQAVRLKEAGLYAYNHNLDTSREFYPSIITTRTYEERLRTLDIVQKAGLSVCSGGIIGMGEKVEDRVGLLHTLSSFDPHPSSVPLNFLMPVKGTPLGEMEHLPVWDMVRMIATARIVMPRAMIRLTAGRLDRSAEEQALCFLAGANSIFSGEKLLTRPNPDFDADRKLFELLGMKAMESTCSF